MGSGCFQTCTRQKLLLAVCQMVRSRQPTGVLIPVV
jgi:hypothetical protein